MSTRKFDFWLKNEPKIGEVIKVKTFGYIGTLVVAFLLMAACSDVSRLDVDTASRLEWYDLDADAWYTLKVCDYSREEGAGEPLELYLSATESGRVALTPGYVGEQNHFRFEEVFDFDNNPADLPLLYFVESQAGKGVLDTNADSTVDLYRTGDNKRSADKQWTMFVDPYESTREGAVISLDNYRESRDYLLHEGSGQTEVTWTDFTGRSGADLPYEAMYWYLEPVAP